MNYINYIKEVVCQMFFQRPDWTIDYLKTLIKKNYCPKTIKNKIAILSYENSNVILDYYRNILSEIPTNLIDIVVVKIGEKEVNNQKKKTNKIHYGNNIRYIDELIKEKEKYKILILPYPQFLFSIATPTKNIYGAKLIGEKLVCVSASFTSCNFDKSFEVYDYIFCASNYIKEKLSKNLNSKTQLIISGNPRYDDLSTFKNRQIRARGGGLKKRLQLDRKKQLFGFQLIQI